jgi:uncharacterized membrane protein YdcZ (DUF606 family)
MKNSVYLFIIWLGGTLLAICLTSQSLFSERPILGYTMLITGIISLILGLFLEFKQWQTYDPLIKKTTKWIAIIVIPSMILMLWYVLNKK